MLKQSKVSLFQFLLALFFPAPFAVYWIFILVKKRLSYTTIHVTIEESIFKNIIVDEIYGPYDVHSLPMYICWEGIIETWRLILVFLSIAIHNPLVKLLLMVMLISCALCSTFLIKPYKNQYVNAIALLLLFSQVWVGLINISISVISILEVEIPEFAENNIAYLYITEKVCTIFIPVVAIFSVIVRARMYLLKSKFES
mgnify:CR=1 FL=1